MESGFQGGMGGMSGMNSMGGMGSMPGMNSMGGMGTAPGMNSMGGMGTAPGMNPMGGMGTTPGMNPMGGMTGMPGMNSMRKGTFASVKGTIVDMIPTRMGNRRVNPCMIYTTIEDMDGNTVNFIISPSTYVADNETLSTGMMCTFWYRTDAPVPLIYPPQYQAVVVAQEKNGRSVDVSFYNSSLVNEEQTLQLNLDGTVDVRTTNNQYYQGSPANHNLVVYYDNTTRSIPAQTTPRKIVVLCDQMNM